MRKILVFVVATLAFTSCNIGAQITVHKDGSGTFGVSMLLRKSDLAMLKGLGAKNVDPIQQMKKSLESNSAKMKVEEFTENGDRGIRGTIPFTSVAELRSEIATMNNSPGGGPLGGNGTFKDFVLEKNASGWHFVSKEAAPSMPGVNQSQSPSQGGSAGKLGDLFANAVQLEFQVTLPGKAGTTNATQKESVGDSTTFTWIPDLHNPKAMTLVADTHGAGSSFPVVPVGIGGGVALIAIVSLVAASKRKPIPAAVSHPSEPDPPPTSSTDPTPPTSSADPPPPEHPPVV